MDAINERIEPTASLCHLCVHRDNKEPYVCDAFPEGIPVAILTGAVSHQIQVEGDNGIQFQHK